jgi:hypothetical protein
LKIMEIDQRQHRREFQVRSARAKQIAKPKQLTAQIHSRTDPVRERMPEAEDGAEVLRKTFEGGSGPRTAQAGRLTAALNSSAIIRR